MANTQLNYTLTLKDLFKKTIQGASNDTKKLDGQMNGLNRTISRIGTGIAAAFSVSAIWGFGKAIKDSLVNYEYFSASIRTLMFGDALAAKALEGQLVKLAAPTPFSLVDVQEGSKQLLAYGFSAGTVVDNMKMLGDVSAGVNKPLGEIVYLYGTLRTQGRAFSKDINQFTTAGINLLPQLAKQFGVTQDAIMGPKGLVESGKVGFKDVEKAFKAMTSEGGQFFGMMDVQSKTVGGQISMLGDNWEQLRVNIGKSQTGIISGTVSWANSFIGAINKVISATNEMSSAFEKYGAKDFTFFQQKGSMLSGIIPLKSEVKRLEDYQAWIQDNLITPSSSSLSESLGAKSGLLLERKNLSQRFANKQIDKQTYLREYAIISAGLDKVAGNISLLNDKRVQTKSDETGAPAKGGGSVGSSTELSGARPQNINIKVDKLVETMNIQAADITGGVTEAKALTSKAFLELLNDANQMANR